MKEGGASPCWIYLCFQRSSSPLLHFTVRDPDPASTLEKKRKLEGRKAAMRSSIKCALGLLLFRAHLSCGFTTFSLERMVGRPIPAASNDDDMFDPLLSPHAYPNGVDAGPSKKEMPRPRQMSRPKTSFGITLPMDETEKQPNQPPAMPSLSLDVFDPTLSPHMYTNGTPDVVIGDNKADLSSPPVKFVGVLLMDHGSKSDVANERLVTLAELYQQLPSATKRIVRAAHMELSSPSIRDGIENLINEGVDEIICHPYFLSPGRHVVVDIPNLVNAAIESLNVKIPVIITDPLGSNTDLMIRAIDAMVVAAYRAKK